MALSLLEEAIAKVKYYFAHEWKGGDLHAHEVAKILGSHSQVVDVMKALGETPDFVYSVPYERGDFWGRLRPSPESGIEPLVFSDSEAPKYLEAVRSVLPEVGALTAYAIAEAVLKASRSEP